MDCELTPGSVAKHPLLCWGCGELPIDEHPDLAEMHLCLRCFVEHHEWHYVRCWSCAECAAENDEYFILEDSIYGGEVGG